MMSKKQSPSGTEIAPNIFWIDGGSSNFYLCVEPEGLVLIDTGMPNKQRQLLQLIAELGYTPQDVSSILVTHADVDHVGSLAAMQQATGAQVYAGTETAVHLTAGTIPQHLFRLMETISRWMMRRHRLSASAIINTFSDGDVLPFLGGMQVLATPGHTPDHHSFYSPTAGVLFAGDALNTRNGRIQSSPPRITADKTAATASAMRLLALAPATIACGHGTPSSNHGMDTLMQLFNELRQ
ncbi:MAG: MBL fold metallo-hydrolase [Anaerolineales bacterium]|nr:MBL fold metallo-hydrolase [Anaerolineales bacterium]